MVDPGSERPWKERSEAMQATRSKPAGAEVKAAEPRRQEDAVTAALLTFVDGITFYRPLTVYFSTPVTTGPWFYEALAQAGAQGAVDSIPSHLLESVRAEAVAQNLTLSAITAVRIRERLPKHTVINPSMLEVSEWTQQQYIQFWMDVIDRSVGKVVLGPGWGFSTGCTLECARSMALGIPVLDQYLEPITAVEAFEIVQHSIDSILANGLTPSGLLSAAAVLEKLV
jgi:hypothetical protein